VPSPRHHRTSEIETGFIDLISFRPCRATGSSLEPSLPVTLSIAALVGHDDDRKFAGLSMLAPKGVVWPSTRLILSLSGNLGSIDDVLGWPSRWRSVPPPDAEGSAGALAGLLALATFLLIMSRGHGTLRSP